MNKDTLIELISEDLSTYQIGDRVGKSQTTIMYWLNKYGLSTNHKPPKKRRTWTDKELIIACANSDSYTNIRKLLGLKSGSNAAIKRHIKRLGINASDIVGRRKARGKNAPIPLSDVMVRCSGYNRGHLKRRLIKEGILKNKCAVCDQDEIWLGKKLVMVLDHINGVPDDHRIENLRILCPNCNSQQDTFAGRNAKHNKK